MSYWFWLTGQELSYDDFVAQVALEPHAAECVRIENPRPNGDLELTMHRVVNGRIVARASMLVVYDRTRPVPAQFVATWCDVFGLDTDDYFVDERDW